MTIKIENIINQWDSETNNVIVRFLNLLTLAKTRRELELALDFINSLFCFPIRFNSFIKYLY